MVTRIGLIAAAISVAAFLTTSLLLPRPSPVTASGAGALGAGGAHTCVVVTGGGVKCWGYNLYGQLGDRTTTNRPAPANVCADDPCASSLSGAATVGGGSLHTCAVTTGGAVKCWGNNEFGQLGNGTTSGGAANTTPLDVCATGGCGGGNLGGIASIDGGSAHTCALTTTGRVKCWGLNTSGQLGDGTTTQRTTPVEVCASGSGSGCSGGSVLTGVAAIAVASTHTCALTTGAGVKCWGSNSFGQLGDGTTSASSNPVDVCASGSGSGCSGGSVLTGIASVSAAGSYTCALTTGGGVKCWGNNEFGQLGNGTTSGSGANSLPVDVCADAACASSLTAIASIASGSRHTCAVTTGGGVKCWGYNLYGELGNNDAPNDSTTPVDACADAACSGLLAGIAAVAAADFNTCVRTEFQAVMCWGRNDVGQLGDGNAPTNSDTTRNVVSLSTKPTPTPTFTPTNTPTATYTPTPTATPTNTSTPKPSPTPKDTATPNPSASGSLKIDADCDAPGIQTKRYVLLTDPFLVCVEGAFPPNPASASGYQIQVHWGEATLNLAPRTQSENDVWGEVTEPNGGPPNGPAFSQAYVPDDDVGSDAYLRLSATDALNQNSDPAYSGPVAELQFSCQNHSVANIELTLPGDPAGSKLFSSSGDIKPTLRGAVIICQEPTYDSDNDGCSNQQELGLNQMMGGRRDPYNQSDYFNPTDDKLNRVDDVIAVVNQYYEDAYLDPPANTIPNPNYDPDTDRTDDPGSSEAWDLLAGNGQQRIDDVLAQIKQYFHDCA